MRDTFTTDSEHVRNEFLGHLQVIGLGAVMRHQQPATQSFLYRMETIADSGLRDLGDQGLRIAAVASVENRPLNETHVAAPSPLA